MDICMYMTDSLFYTVETNATFYCFYFLFYNLNFILYWIIVPLQCFISFCCTTKWISYSYTYIPSFLDFHPTQVSTEHWQSSLSYTVGSHHLFGTEYIWMSIPTSQSILLPLLPLVSISLCSTSMSIFLLCK